MHPRKSSGRFAVAVCCILALGTIVCLTKPVLAEGYDMLYGTWIYEECNNERYRHVDKPDVKASCCTKRSDDPAYECRFSIEKEWKDEQGIAYYNVIEIWSRPPFNVPGELDSSSGPLRFFRIHKLDAAGDVLETAGSQAGYPKKCSRSPVGGFYQIHYRQK